MASFAHEISSFPSRPYQNNLIAYLHIIDLADIDHHQIHGHAPENGATPPPNQDGSITIRKVPWISIGA